MKKTIWILSVISTLMMVTGFKKYNPISEALQSVTNKKITTSTGSEWLRFESRISLEFEIPK